MTEQTGDLIAGRYRLRRCIARGGMGSVWVAEHLGLATDVALKLLRPDHAPNEERVLRLKREAQQAGRLKSPHIVRVQDFGMEQGAPFIVMELLLGEDLGQRLSREGALATPTALRFLQQAAEGLSVAHRAGIVHRDIKPANLFIETQHGEETLKIVDFGVARPKESDHHLTQGGIVWGSPAFMSPEQARGGTIDERTDVWSLAAVLYQMLVGRPPFAGNTDHDVIVKLCTERATRPSELNPALPRSIDRVVERGLSRPPDKRYPSVAELADAATEALSNHPTRPSSSHGPSSKGVRPHEDTDGRETATAPLEPAPAEASAAGRHAPEPEQRSGSIEESPRNSRRRVLPIHFVLAGLLSLVAFGIAFWRPDHPLPAESSPRDTDHSDEDWEGAAPRFPLPADESFSRHTLEEKPDLQTDASSPSSEATPRHAPDVRRAPPSKPRAERARPASTQQVPGDPVREAGPHLPAASADPVFGLPLTAPASPTERTEQASPQRRDER